MKQNSDIVRDKQQQIALVTGSSSGIGYETSLRLARNGIYTYASMRNLSKSGELLGYAKRDNLPLRCGTLISLTKSQSQGQLRR